MGTGHETAILGAGPGGLALAAYFTMQGESVRLYDMPAFAANIDCFKDSNVLEVEGLVTTRVQLAMATTDIRTALAGVDRVFIVTHAAAHKKLAAMCAEYLRDGQPVILCPGYVGGASVFKEEVERHNSGLQIKVMECSVLPFVCHKHKPKGVCIGGLKSKLMLSGEAIDASDDSTIQLMQNCFGELSISRNLLEAGLNETNFIIHACIALLNIGMVEGQKDWTFYRKGLTPAIGHLLEGVDAERLRVVKALGLREISLYTWMSEFYREQGIKGKDIYELLHNFKPFAASKGPCSFAHRYFSEDVAYGLVPLAYLAGELKLDVPLTNMLISLACQVAGVDYREVGRKLTHLVSPISR